MCTQTGIGAHRDRVAHRLQQRQVAGGVRIEPGRLGFSQRRRAQQVQALQASLAVGDEVVTTSGLYGTIVALDDTVVTIDTGAGGTLLAVTLGFLAYRRLTRGEDTGAAGIDAFTGEG